MDTRYFVILDPQEDVLRVFSERAISMALKKEQLAAWQARPAEGIMEIIVFNYWC